MVLKKSVKRPFETVMNGYVSFRVGNGWLFALGYLLLNEFRPHDGFLLIDIDKIAPQVAFYISKLLSKNLFQLFIKSLDLSLVLKILKIDFIVTDDLIELFSNHDFHDTFSLK